MVDTGDHLRQCVYDKVLALVLHIQQDIKICYILAVKLLGVALQQFLILYQDTFSFCVCCQKHTASVRLHWPKQGKPHCTASVWCPSCVFCVRTRSQILCPTLDDPEVKKKNRTHRRDKNMESSSRTVKPRLTC